MTGNLCIFVVGCPGSRVPADLVQRMEIAMHEADAEPVSRDLEALDLADAAAPRRDLLRLIKMKRGHQRLSSKETGDSAF